MRSLCMPVQDAPMDGAGTVFCRTSRTAWPFFLIDGSGYTGSARLMSRGINSIDGKMTLLEGAATKAGAPDVAD